MTDVAFWESRQPPEQEERGVGWGGEVGTNAKYCKSASKAFFYFFIFILFPVQTHIKSYISLIISLNEKFMRVSIYFFITFHFGPPTLSSEFLWNQCCNNMLMKEVIYVFFW